MLLGILLKICQAYHGHLCTPTSLSVGEQRSYIIILMLIYIGMYSKTAEEEWDISVQSDISADLMTKRFTENIDIHNPKYLFIISLLLNIISYLFSVFTSQSALSQCHLETGFLALHVRQIAAGTNSKQALKCSE